jgi:uncharacterized membrane protein
MLHQHHSHSHATMPRTYDGVVVPVGAFFGAGWMIVLVVVVVAVVVVVLPVEHSHHGHTTTSVMSSSCSSCTGYCSIGVTVGTNRFAATTTVEVPLSPTIYKEWRVETPWKINILLVSLFLTHRVERKVGSWNATIGDLHYNKK